MTEFELNNIKDRLLRAKAKIDNINAYENSILGKKEFHKSIMIAGIDRLNSALESDTPYSYSVLVTHLVSIEQYITLIDNCRLG